MRAAEVRRPGLEPVLLLGPHAGLHEPRRAPPTLPPPRSVPLPVVQADPPEEVLDQHLRRRSPVTDLGQVEQVPGRGQEHDPGVAVETVPGRAGGAAAPVPRVPGRRAHGWPPSACAETTATGHSACRSTA